MRLFALRGATSVERNDAEEILDATTELMREIMERNELAPESRQLHLHRHQRPQRRVPGGRRARARLRARAAAVRPRDPRAGSLPRVIRVLIHYYADDDHVARARLPRRGPRACAPTCDAAQ